MAVMQLIPTRIRVALERTRNDARHVVRALTEARQRGVKPRRENGREAFSPPSAAGVSAKSRAVPESDVTTPPEPATEPSTTSDAERVVVFSESGVTLELEEGQTILEAGLQNGVDLIFSCTLGGCGACMLEVAEGEVEYDDPDAICLTPEEIKDGSCLACVGRPRGRVVVEA